jgi:hypothetical protein
VDPGGISVHALHHALLRAPQALGALGFVVGWAFAQAASASCASPRSDFFVEVRIALFGN